MVEEFESFVPGAEDDVTTNRGNWKPTRGVVINLELEKRLLNSLGDLADADGVASVYQMIRNALYAYVKYRTSKNKRAGKRSRRCYDKNCDESV